MRWAVGTGIVNGGGEGMLEPNNNATRAGRSDSSELRVGPEIICSQ